MNSAQKPVKRKFHFKEIRAQTSLAMKINPHTLRRIQTFFFSLFFFHDTEITSSEWQKQRKGTYVSYSSPERGWDDESIWSRCSKDYS